MILASKTAYLLGEVLKSVDKIIRFHQLCARLVVLCLSEDLRLISKLRLALLGHSYGGGSDTWYAIASLLLIITRWSCTTILHLELFEDREGLWILD